MDSKQHWEQVYTTKASDHVSWFQASADQPLALIHHTELGKDAKAVQWIAGDITQTDLPINRFDIWHDRAVFHFLTNPTDRQAYVAQVVRAVKPNGHIIVATFAEDGPEKCSGLPVMRYNPNTLYAAFGDNFTLVSHQKESHNTPFGTVQQFVYCYCRKSLALLENG